MKTTSPIITVQLAAGSAASPYFLDVLIMQKLCRDTCAEEPPVFSPTFSVIGTTEVATGQYLVTLGVQGVIHYTPCGCSGCTVKAMTVNETFTVPVASDTAPSSTTITAGTTVNTVDHQPCRECGNTLVSHTPITLTIA